VLLRQFMTVATVAYVMTTIVIDDSVGVIYNKKSCEYEDFYCFNLSALNKYTFLFIKQNIFVLS